MPSPHPWQSRAVDALVADQLSALDVWRRGQDDERAQLAQVAGARHLRIDAERRTAVLDHEREAVLQRLTSQMYDEERWRGSDEPRVVVACRHPWFVQKVAIRLNELQAVVLECLEDGADAMAAVVVEAPDVLIVGDQLPRVTTLELIQRTRTISPKTVIAVQVSETSHIQEMLNLGAALVVSRRIPPYDVVENALRCLHDGSQVTLV